MLKHLIMWASLCLTAPFVCSQEIADTDSIEYSISPQLLDEVVVKASTTINKTDGTVIRPNKETIRTSTDGIDLLRKLQISRITVNPLTNTVEVAGGGDVTLCINGVESTSAQVAAIQPQDIIRIEYHDSLGIQYAGAAAVIDYITSRHDTGGYVFLNSFDAVGKGNLASIDNLAAQYNKGRSVWTATASYFGKRSDHWSRDYDEVWHYPDAMVTRHEDGLPVTVSNHNLESSLDYNYMHPSGNLLNVRLGLNLNDVPNQEEGDRKALLYTSDNETPVLVTEHTEEHSLQPNLDLYYKHKLSDTRSLIFDGQGSYIHSRMLHEYAEDGIGESSRIKGDKYAFRLLGMYENRAGSRVCSLAAYNNSSFLRNTYTDEGAANVHINQSETALMGEYANRFGNWGVMGNLKAVYRHLGQEVRNLDKYFLVPEINLSYRPGDAWYLRYSASLDYKMPSSAEISDIVQPIQSGMIRRGNPDLTSFRIIDQSFDVTYEHPYFTVQPRIAYRNEHSPVMESVIFENGQFVRTYFNQRSFQRLMLGGALSVRPWQDHLSIKAEPMLTRYFSHGINYRHYHNIFRVGLSVDFSYGHWLAYGNIMSGPANYMYGEEIIEEKDMNQIMVGYKRDKWSIHAGVFNAFINYWMESRNLSSLTPYTSTARNTHSSTYFALRFSLTLNSGHTRHNQPLPTTTDLDSDPGFLQSTK